MHRTASNEAALVSEIPNIINDENVVIVPVSISSDEFCEEQTYPYLFRDLLQFYPCSAIKTCCFYTISFSFEKRHEILIYQSTFISICEVFKEFWSVKIK